MPAKNEDEPRGLMSPAELKQALKFAKRRPAACVIGFTKDRQAVILVDRRKKPRKLLAEATTKAKAAGLQLDPASMRFGRVSVDGSSDSAQANIIVNKRVPGAIRHGLMPQMRAAGFQRLTINDDPALETEADDGTDDADQDGDDADLEGSEAGVTVNGAAPSSPDADALKDELRGLVEQVRPAMAADPSRKGPLLALAKDATARFQAGDLVGTKAGIEALRTALDAPGPAASDAAGPNSGPPSATGTGNGAAAPDAPLGGVGHAAASRVPPDGAVAGNVAAILAGMEQQQAGPHHAADEFQVADAQPGAASGMDTPAPAADDDSAWIGADGFSYKPVPPGTPAVTADIPRALNEAGQAVGDFDASHGKVLTRSAGAARAVGGTFEGVASLAAAGVGAAESATGVGAVVGVPTLAASAVGLWNARDNVQAGLQTAWTGEFHPAPTARLTGDAARALGASDELASSVEGAVDAAQGGLGAGRATAGTMARQEAAATTRATDDVTKAAVAGRPTFGKLTGSPAALSKLSREEEDFLHELLGQGHDIDVVETATNRTPDFMVDGVRTELKTLSGVAKETSENLSSALSSRIMDARGQATTIIVDARNQPGMTKEIAQRGIKRAAGADDKRGGKIQSITVLTSDGPATYRRP